MIWLPLWLGCTPPEKGPVRLTHEQSLQFDLELHMPVLPLASAPLSELRWTVKGDLWGQTPAPVTEAQLAGFKTTSAAEVVAAMLADEVDQSDMWIQFFCLSDSECRLADFQVFGHDFKATDYYGDEEDTWLLSLWGENEVQGLAVLIPSEITSAAYGGELSGQLEATGVEGGEAVTVGEDTVLDWSGLTKDVRGKELMVAVDTLRLYHFSTTDVAAAVGASGLRETPVATLKVEEKSLRFSDLGKIDASGGWALALFAPSTWLPIPVAVVELVPE